MGDDLKARFCDSLVIDQNRKPSTVKAYRERLEWWERWTGKPIHEVGADDIRRLKRERPLRSNTLKGLVVAERRFHQWGANEGLWPLNGVMNVAPPQIDDDDQLPPLPHDQLRRLLGACRRPLEYRLIFYGAYCGMRIGESASIEGSMWHDDGMLRFRGEKNGRMRAVPIHPALEAVKWHLFGSMPTDPSTLQRVKRRMAKRLRLPFVAGQLRKTYSTALYDADVPDEVVGALLGHRGSVTRVYAKVSDKKLRDALERLPY